MHPPPLLLDFNEIQCVPYHPLVIKSTEAFPRFEDFHRTNPCNSVTGNIGLEFFKCFMVIKIASRECYDY